MSTATIRIDPEFQALIPPLDADERTQLEANIVADGCRDPLVLWGDVLLDGHNRYEICTRRNVPFQTVQAVGVQSRDDAKIWMVQNQIGRRNLPTAARVFLLLGIKDALLAKNKERMRESGAIGAAITNGVGRILPTPFDADDIDATAPSQTRDVIADLAGTSTYTVTRVEAVVNRGAPELVQQMIAGEVSINQAYIAVTREEKKAEVQARLEEVAAREVEAPTGIYDVIVIDPPWPMEKIERDVRPNQTGFDYPTMSEDELAALPIPAADDCHMWLWTTQKFLPMALRLLEAWGFKYVCTFVWHKPGGFQPVGLPQFNCEFSVYARKGAPIFLDAKAFNTCFQAPRGAHSEKPEEFYDVVRRVTGGRRVDMFNRRAIEGFAGWGKEAA